MVNVKDPPGPAKDALQDGGSCFHCGEALTPGQIYAARVGGVSRSMCCPGCAAVAQAIVDFGLEDYYRHRSQQPRAAVPVPAAVAERYRAYDHPDVQHAFVHALANHRCEAALVIDGMVCPSCAWLIERRLAQLPGVEAISVNLSRNRAKLRWRTDESSLSELFAAIEQLGYRAYPEDAGAVQQALEEQRNSQLRRIGLSGLLGVQVMMIAVSLYFGESNGIAVQFERFFRYTSLILTAPVLFYAGWPMLHGAWRDIRNRYLGMDVPVSLGLLAAFAGSVYATVTGNGPVYYESVCMFVFFLLVTRYFEFMVRKRSFDAAGNLRALRPVLAMRIRSDSATRRTEEVAVAELAIGDRILIAPGSPIPADGQLLSGIASVDEALLSGESMPLTRRPGDRVIAGSMVIDSPLEVRVTAVGGDTVLARTIEFAERAQSYRPRLAQLAMRIAPWFVATVILIAIAAGGYWYWQGAQAWLAVSVAVLVAACPCALSLAMPAANAAACEFLLGNGVLTRSGAALEALAASREVAFDKTGTLTQGRPGLIRVHNIAEGIDEDFCLRIAAALEHGSNHPIAKALSGLLRSGVAAVATDLHYASGRGVTGRIQDNEYFLGNERLIRERCATARLSVPPASGMLVWLADQRRVLCAFEFRDVLRPGADSLIRALHRLGKRTWVLSGDRARVTRVVAEGLKVDGWKADLLPQQKLERVAALQATGRTVAMVGDGINDAAVLAAADVSIAVGEASQLAQGKADMVVLRSDQVLDKVRLCFQSAGRCVAVMKQNVFWALLYNGAVIPMAVVGWLSPWMAALGMSLSSLLVTANSLRLLRARPVHD
jgi:Cu2+-exporting ATPase